MEKWVVVRSRDFNTLLPEANRLSKNIIKYMRRLYYINMKYDLMNKHRSQQPINMEYKLLGSTSEAFIKLP